MNSLLPKWQLKLLSFCFCHVRLLSNNPWNCVPQLCEWRQVLHQRSPSLRMLWRCAPHQYTWQEHKLNTWNAVRDVCLSVCLFVCLFVHLCMCALFILRLRSSLPSLPSALTSSLFLAECAQGTRSCHIPATCLPQSGMFVCSCLPGYENKTYTCAGKSLLVSSHCEKKRHLYFW